MNIYKYLCSDKNRESLIVCLNENVPELLECDPNNHIHDRINIKEYNNPDGTGATNHSWFDGTGKNRGYRPHQFSLILDDTAEKSLSCQCLWTIFDNTYFNDIEEIAKKGCWGFKMGEENPWKYPEVGTKVKNLILKHYRQQKLKRILKWK